MTPLQVILLGKRMRDAQRRWPDHPQQVSIEVAALEKQFDEVIEPYLDYAKSLEEQHNDGR